MLANANLGLLLNLFVILIFVAVVIIVGGVVWAIIKSGKSEAYTSKRIIIWTLYAIVIAAISWVFNFGWIRFFMTFLLIPVIHGIVFFSLNVLFAKYADKSPKMSKLNLLFIITYILVYVLMPDGADTGEMYFFFGLIHNNILSGIANFISGISFIAHIVLLIMQIVEIRRIKKSISENEWFCS